MPKFVKQYIKLSSVIGGALRKYKDDVEKGIFPSDEQSFTIKDEELRKLLKK